MGGKRLSYSERYTKPRLRERIREEIKQSDRGGPPGQWSARKSQLLVKEYERRGGGYKEGGNVEAAASLHEWTEQQWQTREGGGRARRGGEMARYLPKEVWDRLTPAQRRQADRSKRAASRRGERRVEWPAPVRRAMREARAPAAETRTKADLYLRAKQLDVQGRSRMSKEELAAAVARAERALKTRDGRGGR